MIKKLTTPVLGFILALSVFSCNNSTDNNNNSQAEEAAIDKNAVTWVPDITEALAKAKATGKLLFVECYSPTCPICQSIEPYFGTPEVAEFYNKNFVNYKLDVGVAEQVKFLNDRNIHLPSFPQFLYFDGDGKLVHQGEATATTESILTVGNDAISPDKRSGNFKAKFEKGERDFDFLVKYAVYTRLIKDTVENYKAANALFDIFPKADINTETSWAATKKAVTSIDNGFFKHWINNVSRAGEFEKKAGHAGTETNILGGIIQSSIFSREGKSYGTDKLREIKGFMNKVGAGEHADTFVWEYEVLANLREGKKDAALKIGKSVAQKFADNGPSLVYITKVFNDKYPDNGYVASATEWVNKAAPLVRESNQKAEFNYELARLSLKAGELEVAKKSAEEALKHAKEAKGVDLKKFNDLINTIK